MRPVYLLVLSLILSATTAVIANDVNKQPIDNRVFIELYYQSLCPYCVQFINNQIKPILQIPNIWQIAYIRLIPFGNSDVRKQAMSYSFTCQFGEEECQGNIISNCALNLYDAQTKSLPFVVCLQNSTKNWNIDGPNCAQKSGISYSDIKSCTNSLYGRHWQYQAALQTQFINVDHVPYVVVNGVFNSSRERTVLSNLLAVICSDYRGSVRLPECNR